MMNRNIERRLATIEARQSSHSRQMLVITASDIADRDRQIADLQVADAVGPMGGFLCVLGRPLRLENNQA